MDTLAHLLVLLSFLSALYTALSAVSSLAGGLARRTAARPRRLLPGGSNRRRPRRRTGRDERGALRRFSAAA